MYNSYSNLYESCHFHFTTLIKLYQFIAATGDQLLSTYSLVKRNDPFCANACWINSKEVAATAGQFVVLGTARFT